MKRSDVYDLERNLYSGACGLDQLSLRQLLNLFYSNLNIGPSGVSTRSMKLITIGTIEHYLKRYGKEKEALEKAKKLDTTNALAYHNMGNLYLTNNDTGNAILEFMEATRLNPYAAIHHHFLGLAYLAAGNRLQEAIAAMDRAVSIDPYYAMAHLDLGAALYFLGNYDRAEQEFTAAINLNVNLEGKAHFYIGQIYFKKGRLVEAKKSLRIVIDKNTNPIIQKAAQDLLQEIENKSMPSSKMSILLPFAAGALHDL